MTQNDKGNGLSEAQNMMWRSFIQPHHRRLSSWRWKGNKKKTD